MWCSILYVADFSLGHALLQLFLDSTPSVPVLRKPFLIQPRYEIDFAKRNGNQKHPRTFHFSRAQEKPFRAPKVPRGTKKPIPVALKPIPGTKQQIPGHQKHRPEQKNTTGTKKNNPGKMTPREGKTPFREQKTRSPRANLWWFCVVLLVSRKRCHSALIWGDRSWSPGKPKPICSDLWVLLPVLKGKKQNQSVMILGDLAAFLETTGPFCTRLGWPHLKTDKCEDRLITREFDFARAGCGLDITWLYLLVIDCLCLLFYREFCLGGWATPYLTSYKVLQRLFAKWFGWYV